MSDPTPDGRGSVAGRVAQNLAAWHVYNPWSVTSDWTLNINNSSVFSTGTNTVSWASISFGFTAKVGQSFSFDGPVYASMKIAALYFFNAKLSSTDRANMVSYINGKYGV